MARLISALLLGAMVAVIALLFMVSARAATGVYYDTTVQKRIEAARAADPQANDGTTPLCHKPLRQTRWNGCQR